MRSVGSTGEPLPDVLDDLPRRRHHADHDERSRVERRFTIDEHRVFAVVSVDSVHLDPKLSTQPRRHTDGVNARDSKRTITNHYPGHEHTSEGLPAERTPKTGRSEKRRPGRAIRWCSVLWETGLHCKLVCQTIARQRARGRRRACAAADDDKPERAFHGVGCGGTLRTGFSVAVRQARPAIVSGTTTPPRRARARQRGCSAA